MRLLGVIGVLCVVVTALALPVPTSAETAKPRITVALTFDDGDASHAMVGSLLKRYGMRGTFYINSGRLGKQGFLTGRQVKTLAQQGHEIGGHTLHHVRLTEVAPATARKEICQDRKALLKMGLKVRTFAYPYGAESAQVEKMAAHCGYNAARTVGGLTQPGCLECGGYTETMPPRDPFRVRTPGSVRADNTLEEIQDEVIAAEEKGYGLLPLVFHRVCEEDCGEYAVTPQLLEEFLVWLKERQADGTVVRPLADVIGGKVRPVPGK